ncbi:MAG: hypothetical protein IH843_05115 [Thaumarchaeota archaeon]|nr:hypothetical protein [Nitrososphaerota archaeon]
MVKATYSFDERTLISYVKIFYKNKLVMQCHFENTDAAKAIVKKLNAQETKNEDQDS